jgi:hypothetical protein
LGTEILFPGSKVKKTSLLEIFNGEGKNYWMGGAMRGEVIGYGEYIFGVKGQKNVHDSGMLLCAV